MRKGNSEAREVFRSVGSSAPLAELVVLVVVVDEVFSRSDVDILSWTPVEQFSPRDLSFASPLNWRKELPTGTYWEPGSYICNN